MSLNRRHQDFCNAWNELGGNVAAIATKLGLSRQSVYNRLADFPADVFYMMPTDAGAKCYYIAVAVSYQLRHVWIATGKMSLAAANRFADNETRFGEPRRCIWLEPNPQGKS